MFGYLSKKLFGTQSDKVLKRNQHLLIKVNKLEKEISIISVNDVLTSHMKQ